MAKLIFGCGYLGFRVARRWIGENQTVYAVTRSERRAIDLQKSGLIPILADVTSPDTLFNLPAAQTVLFAIGFDRSAGHSIRQVYVEGLKNVLAALPPEPQRFMYVSSTGVYDQSHGEWVNETSPCRPAREGGKACWEAEQLLHTHGLASKAVILRLGGIYGPGRIPRRSELQEGRPIAAPEHGYLNLIHVEDAASVVLAAEGRAVGTSSPTLYNITDGHPVLRGDYFREFARLAGAPPPCFATPVTDDPRAQRAGSDKRVSNDKMRTELRVDLQYPSYREGLAAILGGE